MEEKLELKLEDNNDVYSEVSVSDLIELYKEKKKLNMKYKNLYDRELSKEFTKGIFNEVIEKALCEGPMDYTMEHFAKYLAHSQKEISEKMLDSFLQCKKVKENKNGCSGMRIVELFRYLRQDKETDYDLINKTFCSILDYTCKNGTKEKNKKTYDAVRKNLLPMIQRNLEIISLKDLDNDVWEQTKELFIQAAIEEKDRTVLISIYNWLKKSDREMGKYTDMYIKNMLDNSEKEKEDERANNGSNNIKQNELKPNRTIIKEKSEEKLSGKVELEETTEKNIDQQEEKKNSDKINVPIQENQEKNSEKLSTQTKKESGKKILENIVQIEVKYAESLENINLEITQLKKQFNKVLRDNEKFKKEHIKSEEVISDLEFEKIKLKENNKILNKTIEDLEEALQKQKEQIIDMNKFKETIIKNKEKEYEEQFNKLAAKLKLEYRDYCDAEDIEMTIDLGENMREQLGAVFSILERNGLDLD